MQRLLVIGIAILAVGCSTQRTATDGHSGTALLPGQLEAVLIQELAARGIDDPAKVPARIAEDSPGLYFDTSAWHRGNYWQHPELGPIKGIELRWRIRLPGDYDGNGEVNISDLAPIARYFDETVTYRAPDDADGVTTWPTGDWYYEGLNWQRAQVDGDGNGRITLADVSTIAAHYGERITRFRAYRKSPSDGSFELAVHPATQNEVAQEYQPMLEQITLAVPFEEDGTQEFRLIAYDAVTGEEGPSYDFVVPPNEPPVIEFNLSADRSTVPAQLTLDMTGSYDPEGQPLEFSFDTDGDGYVDTTLSAGNLVRTIEVHKPGELTIGVTARETWSNLSVQDQESITFELGGNRHPDWDFSVADSGFLHMHHSDIAQIDGRPGILYAVDLPGPTVWDTDQETRYISAVDVTGTAWNEYGLLDIGVPSMMRLSDIIELDGRPAICTSDIYLIGGRVNYLHALDASGTQWPEPFETKTTVSAPIIDFGGKPAMLYFNAYQATQLEFRVANDAAGAAWDTTSQMSPAQMQLIYELVMLEGRPAAVCFGGDMPVYRASDSSAQNWELTGNIPVPSNGDGQRARVSVLNDRLILAYVTGIGEDRHVEFAGALDPNGSSWNGPASLGFVASDFVFDLAPVDGRPAVVLQGPEYDLRLALAEDANGAAWAEPIVVSNYGSVGSAVSMELVDGQPAIATFNRSTGDLEYYRRQP